MARAKRVDATKEDFLAVKSHLENGGTKKDACQMLGIAYNTARLDKLIEQFDKEQDVDKRLRAKKRKEAVTDQEVVHWITSYLNGAGFDELSKTYYRSASVIKHHLEKHGALLRASKVNRLNPPDLPEQCISDSFKPGQYVWSSAYNTIALVKAQFKNAYRIQVLGNGVQEMAYQAPYELGDLSHLENLGVDLSSFEDYTKSEDVKIQLYETMTKANKAARK